MSRAEISRLLSGCTGLYLFNEEAGAICNDYIGICGPGRATGTVGTPSTTFNNATNRPKSPIGSGWRTRSSGSTDYAFIRLPHYDTIGTGNHKSRMRPFNKNYDFSVVMVLRSDTTTAHDTFGTYPDTYSPGMPIYPATPKMQYQALGSAGADATTTATVGGIYAYGCSGKNTITSNHPYALYFDGRQVGSGTYGVAMGAGWSIKWIGTYGTDAVGNAADYMTFFFFGFWDRWLSKEEHQLIARIALHDREQFVRQNMWSYYTAAVAGPSNIKTWWGLPQASVKTVNGLAIASVKSGFGLT